jgi:hypothetical protein
MDTGAAEPCLIKNISPRTNTSREARKVLPRGDIKNVIINAGTLFAQVGGRTDGE